MLQVVRGDTHLMSPHNAGASPATPDPGADAGGFMCVHITWGCDELYGEGARRASRELEATLRPFDARPHWGKIFHAEHTHDAADIASIGELYSHGGRMARFKALCAEHDPTGKFRSSPWVRRVLGPFPLSAAARQAWVR